MGQDKTDEKKYIVESDPIPELSEEDKEQLKQRDEAAEEEAHRRQDALIDRRDPFKEEDYEGEERRTHKEDRRKRDTETSSD